MSERTTGLPTLVEYAGPCAAAALSLRPSQAIALEANSFQNYCCRLIVGIHSRDNCCYPRLKPLPVMSRSLMRAKSSGEHRNFLLLRRVEGKLEPLPQIDLSKW